MRTTALVCLCCLSWTSTAGAGLRIDSLFSDHVVLQRQMRVPVWGTTSPGASVEVEFAGQSARAKADERGNWRVDLEPLAASSQGRQMSITGDGASIAIDDVVVGEVWIGSGQSNMALAMKESEDGKAALATARHPMLRLFKRPAAPGRQPLQWVPCTPQEVEDFSAVAYFFGKHLEEHLDVPVGLIVRAVGGTTIQRWVVPGSEERNDVLAAHVTEARRREDEFGRFEAERAKYDKRNRPPPETARWLAEMANLSYYRHPTGGLYKRMVRPLQPLAVRGVIWYQGEFNNRPGQAYDYRYWQPVLIDGWREDWGQGDFPFLFVQMQVLGNPTTPLLRESQSMTLRQCPNTAMAVICDQSAELHPPLKKLAGDRLAMAARSLVYGEDFPCSGPTFKRMEVADGKAVLTFEHVGRGLQGKGDVLGGFFVCGEDRRFRPAQAEITGPDRVTVRCEEIEAPAAVRYAWMNDPRGVMSLTNSAGLPASPFRTDEYREVAPLDGLLPGARAAKSPRKRPREKPARKAKTPGRRERTGTES